jgi:hypothetical protein
VLALRLLLALSSNWVALFMRWVVSVFSLFGKLFAFALTSRQAVNCCLPDTSTLTAMAQMKPNSSRPTAVMILPMNNRRRMRSKSLLIANARIQISCV